MSKYTKPTLVVLKESNFVKATLMCSHKCGNGSFSKVGS